MVRRRTQKRRQQGEEGDGIDRISELPEPLICRILSLVDDMKDVVKTSVLAKKWRYHWIHVDRIIYSCDLTRKKNCDKNWENDLESFIYSFVDRTLMKCISPKINKFSISGFGFDTDMQPHDSQAHPINEMFCDYIVDKWIEYVISKNVEDLKLGLKGLNYIAPTCLYNNSCLQKLEIDHVGVYDTFSTSYEERCPLNHLDEDIAIHLRVLKSLTFKGIYLPDTFLENIILAGCPMLETMVLEKVRGLEKLNVTSRTMFELKLLDLAEATLEISAPWVKKLEISGSFIFYCKLVSVPSLEYADLHYCTYDGIPEGLYRDCNMFLLIVENLLEPVHHVNELTIGSELLQALSLSQMTTDRPFPSFKCKYLTIPSPLCVHEVPGIVCLLESSPNLETLVLKISGQCHLQTYCHPETIRQAFSSFHGVDYLNQREKNFPCLKDVKIDCVDQRPYPCNEDYMSDCMCFELKIAAHIIRNAPVLEKLVIVSTSNRSGARYLPLLRSQHKVGEKAVRWQLKKKTNSTYEFSFDRNAQEFHQKEQKAVDNHGVSIGAAVGTTKRNKKEFQSYSRRKSRNRNWN